MKILIFTENTHRGGLDSFLISLINHWPNPSDQLILLCNQSHPGIPDIKSRIHRPFDFVGHQIAMYLDLVLLTHRYPPLRFLRRIFSPFIRFLYFPYYIFKLHQYFSELNPDCLMIVNGGHPGGDTCRAAAIAWVGRPVKCVYNFHNLAVNYRWFERWPDALVDFLVVRNSKFLIGVSRSCAASIQKRVGLIAMSKVVHILNGIEEPVTQKDLKNPIRQELKIPSDSLLCLMLASYERRKGHDFLLRAFKKVITEIPNAYLLICGDGYPNEIDMVKNLISNYRLDKNVFLDKFRIDANALVQQSDLLLVASQAYESFGLVSVEAMANAIPVVATNVGGIPEVVLDGYGGYCFDPSDVDGYANQIIRFLKSHDLRKTQGERGYERYRNLFSANQMAQQYCNIIYQIYENKF